jgi:signal transduction histidine kinase
MQTVFEVSDQGIGIPHDEIEDLFESFHRASNVGDIQGTGLGLAIVKQAVELHGGTVQVHSAVGHGTRFTVRLHPEFR